MPKSTDKITIKNGIINTPHDVYGSHSHKIDVVAGVNNVITDVATRGPFGRNDYDSFRPSEATPERFADVIRACRSAYVKTGVIRQVIDLMTDFVCENVRFVHPDPKAEVFLNVWSKKVGLRNICEEFARHFLIDCNVVVKRTTAKLTEPVEKQWNSETVIASPDVKMYKEKNEVSNREIPIRYNFLNVIFLQWVGGEMARFTGARTLNYMVPKEITDMMNSKMAKTDLARQIYDNLPNDFKKAASDRKNLVPLDMDKVYVAHNKKDDWDIWATPFLVSVLPDIVYKDKLRLADQAALDGIINVIRIWKLGDHTGKDGPIFPPRAAFTKLGNILESNVGGGAIDIIWDSLIDMKEYYPPVEKILGSEKYVQVNQDILVGLGVPDVLLGGKGANFSNSAIQLKTIIERIKSVRETLNDFLYREIALVCKAFDIKGLPSIEYQHLNLYDENVGKQLMLQLFDRGIVSDETMLEEFDKDIIIEHERLKRQEKRVKDSGVKVRGPYIKDDLETGTNNLNTSKTGGRPVNTKTVSRKTREANPRASDDILVSAIDNINSIYDIVNQHYLESHDVSNLRKLTGEQKKDLDSLITIIIASTDPYSEKINSDIVIQKIKNLDKELIDDEIVLELTAAVDRYTKTHGQEPTMAQKRNIQAIAWTTCININNGDEENENQCSN